MPRFSKRFHESQYMTTRRWICCLITPWLILASLSHLIFRPANQILPDMFTTSTTTTTTNDKRFLAAVIFNRVFSADKFNISSSECHQWIQYMLYAGVDHIFWYDTAHHPFESQEASLRSYVDSGVLSYHRFYSIFPVQDGSDFHYEQDNSYAHFLSNYNTSVTWVVEMDVDEYPFSPHDLDPGFLSRFVLHTQQEEPNVSQILLQCMMFLGNPIGEGWVVERYQRRKPETEGRTAGYHSRQKPIFKPGLCEGVTSFDPHKFVMRIGSTVVASQGDMRFNHYWGPRLTNFGPDTPETVGSLVEDRSIQPIVARLKSGSSGSRMVL